MNISKEKCVKSRNKGAEKNPKIASFWTSVGTNVLLAVISFCWLQKKSLSKIISYGKNCRYLKVPQFKTVEMTNQREKANFSLNHENIKTVLKMVSSTV